MAKWSWSKLQQARKCAYAPHLEHVEKASKRVPGYVHAGVANHKILEKAIKRSRLASPPQPLELVVEELRQEHEDGAYSRADPKIFDRIEGAVSLVPVPQLGEELILEKKFLVDELGDIEEDGCKSSDAFCSGLVDYCILGPERLVVRDWKTGWGKGEFDEMDQVILYAGFVLAWAMENAYIIPNNVDVGILHPFRPSADQSAIMPASMVKERYQEILMEMADLNHVFDSGMAPEPTFGDHCASCMVAAECPTYMGKVNNPTLWESDDEAHAMLKVLKKEAGVIEEYLKKKIHKRGQVPLNDGRFLHFKEIATEAIDVTKAYTLLRQRGVTSEEMLHHFGLTKTALKKLVNDKEIYEEVLLHASYIKSTSKRLTISNEEE